MEERVGSPDPETNAWLETYTGRKYWAADPRAEDITIFDIAHSLAYKCRYNGHTANYYSVAEHCVTLALLARSLRMPVDVQFQMLMHDGSEAYLPDVPRPIKHFFPGLVAMEKLNDRVIREWCGLSHDVPPVVKEWDSRIIVDERRQVLLPSGHQWVSDSLTPLNVTLACRDPYEAQMHFLSAYQVIGAEYHGRIVLCAYEPGEFQSAAGTDRRGFSPADVRMIDLRGKCAMFANADGYIRFQHGAYELRSPGS